MNRKLLFAVGLVVASPAFADDVDLLPNGYVSSVMRAAQANSSKDLAAVGSIGEPGENPSHTTSAKTRAQVIAETREAARLGLLNNVGEAGITVDVTPEQLHQIEQAGLRAVAIQSAAK